MQYKSFNTIIVILKFALYWLCGFSRHQTLCVLPLSCSAIFVRVINSVLALHVPRPIQTYTSVCAAFVLYIDNFSFSSYFFTSIAFSLAWALCLLPSCVSISVSLCSTTTITKTCAACGCGAAAATMKRRLETFGRSYPLFVGRLLPFPFVGSSLCLLGTRESRLNFINNPYPIRTEMCELGDETHLFQMR